MNAETQARIADGVVEGVVSQLAPLDATQTFAFLVLSLAAILWLIMAVYGQRQQAHAQKEFVDVLLTTIQSHAESTRDSTRAMQALAEAVRASDGEFAREVAKLHECLGRMKDLLGIKREG